MKQKLRSFSSFTSVTKLLPSNLLKIWLCSFSNTFVPPQLCDSYLVRLSCKICGLNGVGNKGLTERKGLPLVGAQGWLQCRGSLRLDGERGVCSAGEGQHPWGQACGRVSEALADTSQTRQRLAVLKALVSYASLAEMWNEGVSKMGFNLLEKVFHLFKYTFIYHI